MAAIYSDYSREDVRSIIRSFQPDIIGMGLTINGRMSSVYEFALDIKQNFRKMMG